MPYAVNAELIRSVELGKRSSDLDKVARVIFSVDVLLVIPQLCVYIAAFVAEGKVAIRNTLDIDLFFSRFNNAEALCCSVFICCKIHNISYLSKLKIFSGFTEAYSRNPVPNTSPASVMTVNESLSVSRIILLMSDASLALAAQSRSVLSFPV